jgi:hypothetical protein
MKRAHRSSGTPSTLSESLQKRLNAHAIVAGTAGVTMLALAQTSEAEVVYTPANQTIGRNGSYKLDLNNDGIIDYILGEHAEHYGNESFQVLSVRAANGNQVNCPSSFCISGNTYAAALNLGVPIGNSQRRGWLGRNVRMADEDLHSNGSVFYSGGWSRVDDGYLGLRIQVNGETHFGWARLTVSFTGGPPDHRTWVAHLTGYAYETIPGKPIQAGQTRGSKEDDGQASSKNMPLQLGALALGSKGIALWRRED